jgi:hypothetical protein
MMDSLNPRAFEATAKLPAHQGRTVTFTGVETVVRPFVHVALAVSA